MSHRLAKFASALVATILAGANYAAVAQNATATTDTKAGDAKTVGAKTADACLSSPKGAAPAGSHWYYHLDRATKKQCWYIGEAKASGAKAAKATAQRQAAPPSNTAEADTASSPPQQTQQSATRKSVTDAHAEWPSPQAAAPAATDAAQPDSTPTGSDTPAPPADVNGQSPNARWLDASSMAGTNGTQRPAVQPAVATQADADAAPQQAAPNAAAAPAAVETPSEKSSSSTQMLLIVMVGALALAGLVSALIFRLTRTRTPPYDVSDEWRAPWDSSHNGRASASRPRSQRLSEMPQHRGEPLITRRDTARDRDQTEADSRQITAMLQQLARNSTN